MALKRHLYGAQAPQKTLKWKSGQRLGAQAPLTWRSSATFTDDAALKRRSRALKRCAARKIRLILGYEKAHKKDSNLAKDGGEV
jgi:hypothetical protein